MFEYRPITGTLRIDKFAAARDQRDFYTDQAKDLLKNAATGWTDEHEAKYKKIVDVLGEIDDGVNEEIQKLQRQVRSETPVEPVSEFRDAGGKIIPAYKHGQRLSESRPEYQLGDFVRAMVAPHSASDKIRNDLAEGADSAGGHTVPAHVLREFIDLMRSKLVASLAGVRVVPLETLKTKLARLATEPIGAWRAENTEIVAEDPTFDAVEFTVRNFALHIKASNELLADSVNVSEMITNTLAQQAALQLDQAIFYGLDTNVDSPTGIIYDTDIPVIPAGGPLTDYSHLLAGLQSLSDNNAEVSDASFIMAPRDFYKLQGLADSTGQPLQQPTIIANRPVYPTTTVKVDEGGGTESRIFVGDFSNVLLGVRDAARIVVLRERFADFNQTSFILLLRADVAVAQPKAVCMITGITP